MRVLGREKLSLRSLKLTFPVLSAAFEAIRRVEDIELYRAFADLGRWLAAGYPDDFNEEMRRNVAFQLVFVLAGTFRSRKLVRNWDTDAFWKWLW